MIDSTHFQTVAKSAIEQVFRQLLETKHLYQTVEVPITGMSILVEQAVKRERSLQSMTAISTRGSGSSSFKSAEEISKESWEEVNVRIKTTPLQFQFGATPMQTGCLPISVPTVKTTCQNEGCGGLWPHNACPDPSWLLSTLNTGGKLQQIFVLQYQCQNCKKEPVSFLVKRDGLKLTLTGRSPMESIGVPKFIPKDVRKFYRGAVIAFNSGALLPAIFMLRTMVEQHMRQATKSGNQRMTADQLVEAYATTLNEGFNSQFQSLKPVYSNLSEAIHAAQDDAPQLFETERTNVLSHFEAKEAVERLSVRLGKTTAGKTDQPPA
jgi:hypothetical protein